MDVNCNDPSSTTLNDSPKQVRVKSVKLSQLLHADTANDVSTGPPLKKKRLLEKERGEGEGESDNACDIQRLSRSLLPFQFHTQEKPEKIFGKLKKRKIKSTLNSVSKKSQSSKEKERIRQEEFEKFEGYRLFKEALAAHAIKKSIPQTACHS